MVRRYEIAGVGIAVETQADYPDTAPYALFLKPDGPVHVRFSFAVGPLPPEEGRLVLRDSSMRVYQSVWGQRRFLLKNREPYACSQLPEVGEDCAVAIASGAPELWGGFVFAAVGLEHLLVRRGRIILHASYIDWNGKAILFTAPCQTGKSTQAGLWERFRGAETINGDRACLSADAGAVMVHGLPMAGTSGICQNRSLPVAAIVYLSQAPDNLLERLRGAAAFKAVFSGSWINDWDRRDMEAAADAVSRIVTGVPVFHLACRPDQEAVDLLAAALGG